MSGKKTKAARRLALAVVAGDEAKANEIAASANISPTPREVRRAVRIAMAPMVAAMPKPPPPKPPLGRKQRIAVSLVGFAAITALAFAMAALLAS